MLLITGSHSFVSDVIFVAYFLDETVVLILLRYQSDFLGVDHLVYLHHICCNSNHWAIKTEVVADLQSSCQCGKNPY